MPPSYHRWAEILIASHLSWYILSQGLSLLRVTWYVLKQFWTELFWSTKKKKKKISYYSIIFQSHSPLNFLVLSEAKVKTGKTPRERLLSQYFWLTKTFLRKPVSMRFQFQFYKPKKTQNSSDKVQISIQIFSWARWTAKPFNMITSLFWDKGKKINENSDSVWTILEEYNILRGH